MKKHISGLFSIIPLQKFMVSPHFTKTLRYKICYYLFIYLGVCFLPSCSDKFFIRKVADEVVLHTNYGLNEIKTGEKPSRYNEWMYQNYIIMEGLGKLGVILNNKSYAGYPHSNIDFFCAYQNSVTKNNAFKSLAWYVDPTEIWHCGMISALVEQQAIYPSDVKTIGIKTFENFLAHAPRLDNGLLVRIKEGIYHSRAIQIDDIYMLSPYWVRMWKLTGNKDFLDKAVLETIAYYNYLWDNDRQLMHCLWLEKTRRPAACYWGRGNGWYIMALTDLLTYLPADHPRRDSLLHIFNTVANGLRKYQDKQGLWHQLIDVKDSFAESSCSGMFTYCILKGFNEGWLDQSFEKVGLDGWKGLKSKLTNNYQIKDCCPPTDMSDDINYYLNRPRITNDQHAIGPFLLAGLRNIKAGRETQSLIGKGYYALVPSMH